MRIFTVINAKEGCGKSTIAMNLAAALAGAGYRMLLIDLDPQAQLTAWIDAGDGLASPSSIVMPMAGKQPIGDVIQATKIANLSVVASAQPLEDLDRQMAKEEGYHLRLTEVLGELVDRFEFCVIDSPNQISPIVPGCSGGGTGGAWAGSVEPLPFARPPSPLKPLADAMRTLRHPGLDLSGVKRLLGGAMSSSGASCEALLRVDPVRYGADVEKAVARLQQPPENSYTPHITGL